MESSISYEASSLLEGSHMQSSPHLQEHHGIVDDGRGLGQSWDHVSGGDRGIVTGGCVVGRGEGEEGLGKGELVQGIEPVAVLHCGNLWVPHMRDRGGTHCRRDW